MTSKWAGVAAAGLLAAAVTGFILAQDRPAPPAGETPQRPADEAAIREASQALARAFEKGDAKAVAGAWTEEGEYSDDQGKKVRGRAALEKAYAEFFAKRPELKVESKTASVRFLGPDTAVEEGTFTVRSKNAPADASRYSALYTRQNGRWLIALLKEWGDEETTHASLGDLAWLIGSWETEGDGPRAQTTYEWADPNKKFIRCRYTVAAGKGVPGSSGTQVIGIDPASGQVRSWTFDSDGGIGEATWDWDNDHWAIDSDATLADGTRTTATNFLTPAGDGAFTWRSVERTLDGEKQPDIGPVKVRRAAAGQ
jgi:uncharacterized protein (TIGR02246 family)